MVVSIFIVLMLIGGRAFSMTEGIRVSRLIPFAKSIKQSIKATLVNEKVIPDPRKQTEANNHENIPVLVSILLFTFTLVSSQ